MGFDEGRIILDSVGAYFPGQTVYGRIVFDQEKVMTIYGIYVDIKGFCKVHWTTWECYGRSGRMVSHDAHEEYFRRETYIFGALGEKHHLQPGHHDFRFNCLIPANSPSSFEDECGHIRYRIKVIMVTSGIFSFNKIKTVGIRIIAPLDLNQIPYCKEPIEYELKSSYCCWCVSVGSSEVQVRLPVGGYCPGQLIPVEVTCKNPSSVMIDTINFAINKHVKFMATSEPGTRNIHTTVARIKKGPIPAGTTRNWTVEMEVPTMDIYNLNACRFIDINYKFKVSMEVDGCHVGAEKVHPIIFGNVPLVGFQDNVLNPLQDQMPRPMDVQNVHGANVYPPAPITNQPLPNPFPTVSPDVSPYPPPYPGITPPYPGGNLPHPGNNPPYPGVPRRYPRDSSPAPDDKKFPLDGANSASSIPPYNPDFVNKKKDEKSK